nr:glutamic acid-rich protein-like [Ipomoea batatas]
MPQLLKHPSYPKVLQKRRRRREKFLRRGRPSPQKDPSSTLPQELANVEEIEYVVEAEGTVGVQPLNKETKALPIPVDAQYMQINVDSELAKQIAHEELFDETPTREDILRTELKRMYSWQKWRMSRLEVIGRTCSLMWKEEQWALDWMSTRSVFDATRPDEIDGVYAEKLAGRFACKGKGRVMDEEFSDPKEHEMEDMTMIAKVTNICRIQSSFRDIRPNVGTSRGNEVPEDCDRQEKDEDKESEKDTSGCNDLVRPPNDDDDDDDDDELPNNQSTRPPVDASREEAPDDASDSSSSNDLDNDENDNQGISNHHQDEEELRVIPAEDTDEYNDE